MAYSRSLAKCISRHAVVLKMGKNDSQPHLISDSKCSTLSTQIESEFWNLSVCNICNDCCTQCIIYKKIMRFLGRFSTHNIQYHTCGSLNNSMKSTQFFGKNITFVQISKKTKKDVFVKF